METPRLIGFLCMAVNKVEIELTAVQLERLGKELKSLFMEEREREHQQFLRNLDIIEESHPLTDATIAAHKKLAEERLKKAQDPVTDSKIESVNAPAPKVLKPKPVKEKASCTDSQNALTPRQQQLWDYVRAHKDASLKQICTDVGISLDNYYFLKRKLSEKGYIIPNKNTAVAKKHGRNILANIGKIHQEEKSELDKRMEDAYLGEHPNIQPDPVPKQPVSKQAKRLYEYMQSHPDSRMPKTCEDLNITSADYYILKAQLKKNGWIESAVENVQAF